MEDKPILTTAIFNFIQECNTNGTTGGSDEDEQLSITMENAEGSLDIEGGFYVLRTEGWSVNNSEELMEIFNQIKNIKYDNTRNN
jgi:hypothetical protein